MEAIYARQSLDVRDSLSISTQIAFCRKHCMDNAEPLIYEDKGFSGKNTKRPAFQQMLNDIKDGKINRVIIYKLDRLSRSILDFSDIWRVFEERKVDLLSATQNFDTGTPMGKAMLFIVMVFAEMERATIAERVKDNYYSRIKTGRWPGGPAPYGFQIGRILDEQGRKVPTLIPDERIAYVAEMYERYAYSEASLGGLARWLNERKIPGIRSETWGSVAIAKLLRNPVYARVDYDVYCYMKSFGMQVGNEVEEFTGEKSGMILGKRGTLAGGTNREYKDYSDMVFVLANWEGIIPSKLWLAANYKLDTNQQVGANGKGTVTWLGGIIKCASCGYAIMPKSSKTRETRRLYCSGKYVRQNQCKNHIGLCLGEVEEKVELELEKVIESCRGESLEFEPELSNAEKIELEKIENSIENMISAIKNGEADGALYSYINKEVQRLDHQKKEILDRLNQKTKKRVVIPKINFKELDMAEKHLVAASYIKRVLLTEDEICIEWMA